MDEKTIEQSFFALVEAVNYGADDESVLEHAEILVENVNALSQPNINQTNPNDQSELPLEW